jgi:hypothetical protein
LGVRPPQLLEEERDCLIGAAIAQVANPRGITSAALMPGLPARDEPVDTREVKSFKRSQQRLGGHEPNSSRHGAERVGATDEPPILDRDAHPHVRVPVEGGREVRCEGKDPNAAMRALEEINSLQPEDLEDL